MRGASTLTQIGKVSTVRETLGKAGMMKMEGAVERESGIKPLSAHGWPGVCSVYLHVS